MTVNGFTVVTNAAGNRVEQVCEEGLLVVAGILRAAPFRDVADDRDRVLAVEGHGRQAHLRWKRRTVRALVRILNPGAARPIHQLVVGVESLHVFPLGHIHYNHLQEHLSCVTN